VRDYIIIRTSEGHQVLTKEVFYLINDHWGELILPVKKCEPLPVISPIGKQYEAFPQR